MCSCDIRRTGVVYNVTPAAVGVIVKKVVGNRYIEKRVNLRVEHVKHSKSRQEFLERVQVNAEKSREAKKTGGTCYNLAVQITIILITHNIYREDLIEAHPSPTPHRTHRLWRIKCSPDDCSHPLRDHHLGVSFFALLYGIVLSHVATTFMTPKIACAIWHRLVLAVDH